MPSSHSLSFVSPLKADSTSNRVVTWVIRLLTGGVFLFSGFTKAIDPWGTLYKIEDYLAVMGLDIWPGPVKVGAFLLCAVEFIIGAMLCLGAFRRTAAWTATAVMCFMLPLTLWIAIADPVADCGCFGDAFIISNWATFYKNVALMAFCIWLSKYNRYAGCLITPALQWMGLIATGLFCIVIEGTGYLYQPLIDFRPYPVGAEITDVETQEEPEYRFIYEKDGVKKEFGETDTLPDENDGWVFIDRVAVNEKGVDSRVTIRHERSLRLWDPEIEEDLTEEMLQPQGDILLLVMSDLGRVSIASTWKINSLYDWTSKNGIEMIGVVAADASTLEEWKDLSMPEYPIYTAEDTVLKELVRGNPAVVFIRDGVIRWKSSLRALNTDDFMAPETGANPLAFALNNTILLINGSAIYLSIIAALISFSLLFRVRGRVLGINKLFRFPRLKHQQLSTDSPTHDDKAHPGE